MERQHTQKITQLHAFDNEEKKNKLTQTKIMFYNKTRTPRGCFGV